MGTTLTAEVVYRNQIVFCNDIRKGIKPERQLLLSLSRSPDIVPNDVAREVCDRIGNDIRLPVSYRFLVQLLPDIEWD
jgi:hypothetical protein